MLPQVAPGETVVLILPDGGDRYLDTIYDDTWVQRHFGAVAHLWDDSARPADETVELVDIGHR
ncbi:hypothetical protein ACFQ1B_02550 [Streptomyces mexicanus]